MNAFYEDKMSPNQMLSSFLKHFSIDNNSLSQDTKEPIQDVHHTVETSHLRLCEKNMDERF